MVSDDNFWPGENNLKTGALPERKPGSGSDVQCDPVPVPAGATADTRAATASTADTRIDLAVTIPR